jgi:hypothetical protein
MEVKPEEESIDYDAALQFTISKDGKIYIYFHIKNASSELETVLAKFLFDLNTSKYSEDILNIFSRYAKEEPHLYDSIKSIITQWNLIAQLMKTLNNDNQLVVSPSNFVRGGAS